MPDIASQAEVREHARADVSFPRPPFQSGLAAFGPISDAALGL